MTAPLRAGELRARFDRSFAEPARRRRGVAQMDQAAQECAGGEHDCGALDDTAVD